MMWRSSSRISGCLRALTTISCARRGRSWHSRNAAHIWPNSKDSFFKAMRRAADNAKIKWKQNALRHSFISYRLAEIQDVNRVALEAGNSPQMIFRHYRELATPQQARTWFAILPQAALNVVPIGLGSQETL